MGADLPRICHNIVDEVTSGQAMNFSGPENEINITVQEMYSHYHLAQYTAALAPASWFNGVVDRNLVGERHGWCDMTGDTYDSR